MALRCVALIAAAALLAGCGQKGALKLPAPPAASAAAATGTPSPATLPATAASTPATR